MAETWHFLPTLYSQTANKGGVLGAILQSHPISHLQMVTVSVKSMRDKGWVSIFMFLCVFSSVASEKSFGDAKLERKKNTKTTFGPKWAARGCHQQYWLKWGNSYNFPSLKCSSCRPSFMLSTCQIVRCQGTAMFWFITQQLGENPPYSHFFFFCCKLSKDFTLRLNPGKFGRSTDIHVYFFWNICSRTDESSCHGTERSIKLVHMLSHTSKMAPASLPLCLPMKGKAAHQTADKNLDKKGIFYSQPSTKREEKCDIRDRRNLLLFRLWTLNSLSVLMRKQDQRTGDISVVPFLYK